MRKKGNFAVVTGASTGLGRCYALELARRGFGTILVSLPGEGLSAVADECRGLGVECYVREEDLTEKQNVVGLCHWIDGNFEISVLVNNAGCGGTRTFVNSSVEYLDNIIQLNIRATTLMTRLLLPNMLRQEKAYILNVSSMASFCPIGFKTVYPASKRFVQHFTRGLCQELKGTSVFVSVVHPGPMKTNLDATKRIERQKLFGRIGLLSPEKVARRSIAQLFRRDSMILLGIMNKLNWLLLGIVPSPLSIRIVSNVVHRELQTARI